MPRPQHLPPRPQPFHPRKKARILSGFSQDALAIVVAKDRAQISRWERGLYEFSDDDVRRIAAALDVPVDQLIVVDESAPAAAVAR